MSPADAHARSAPAFLHEAMLTGLPFPVLCLEINERVLFANPAAELFFDASSAVMKRNSFEKLLVPNSPLLSPATRPRTVHMIALVMRLV